MQVRSCALLAAFLCVAAAPAFAIDVTACQDLTVENATYVLRANIGSDSAPVNIGSAGSCMRVRAAGITFDLSGRSIVVDKADSPSPSSYDATFLVESPRFLLTNSSSTVSDVRQAADSQLISLGAVSVVSTDDVTIGSPGASNIRLYWFSGRKPQGLVKVQRSTNVRIRNIRASDLVNDTNPSAMFELDRSVVTIDNVDIDAHASSTDLAAIENLNSTVAINNSRIRNASGSCIVQPSGGELTGANNTCNGGDLLIFNDPTDLVIRGRDVAEIVVIQGNRVLIEDNIIRNGMLLSGTQNAIVRNNRMCITGAGGACVDYAIGQVVFYMKDGLQLLHNTIWAGGGRAYFNAAVQIRGGRNYTLKNNHIRSVSQFGVYQYAPDLPRNVTYEENYIEVDACDICQEGRALQLRRCRGCTWLRDTFVSDAVGVSINGAPSLDPADTTKPAMFMDDVRFRTVAENLTLANVQSDGPPNTVVFLNPREEPRVVIKAIQFGVVPKLDIGTGTFDDYVIQRRLTTLEPERCSTGAVAECPVTELFPPF
jgi:hypothetical protein